MEAIERAMSGKETPCRPQQSLPWSSPVSETKKRQHTIRHLGNQLEPASVESMTLNLPHPYHACRRLGVTDNDTASPSVPPVSAPPIHASSHFFPSLVSSLTPHSHRCHHGVYYMNQSYSDSRAGHDEYIMDFTFHIAALYQNCYFYIIHY